MKSNKCGKEIDKCLYGNPECLQKSTHWFCNEKPCGVGNVGLGCVDPCRVLKITHKGNYGINCTAPQSYIQLNADTLWQAWYNLFAFTWNKFWGFIN